MIKTARQLKDLIRNLSKKRFGLGYRYGGDP